MLLHVIKKINNNVALATDESGASQTRAELVIFGRGVGFPHMPYTLRDERRIQRIFRDVSEHVAEAAATISDEVLVVSSDIVDLAKVELSDLRFSPNLVFTLADHLQFAVERTRENITIENPLAADVAYVYPREYGLGKTAIGIALVYPTMVALTSGEVLGTVNLGVLGTFSWYATFFGLPIIMPASGYTSSVIPVLLMVWFGSKVEHWVKSWIPDALKMFFVPLITVTAAVVAGYLIIGPIATVITNLLEEFFYLIFNLPAVGRLLGSVIVSAFWMPLVIFGFHWSLVPIALVNLSTLGSDYVLACMIGHSFSLGAVVFAMYLKNKDEQFREIALPAMISAFFFGITEPAIYGVALPDKKAFIHACIGSVAAGVVVGLSGSVIYISGGLGVFNWLSYIDPSGKMGITYMIWAIIASLVAAAVGFVIEISTYKAPVSAEHAAQ